MTDSRPTDSRPTDPTPANEVPANEAPANEPAVVREPPVVPETAADRPELVEPAAPARVIPERVKPDRVVTQPGVGETAAPVVAPPAHQTVYVQAPSAPRRRSNRGIGVLLAVFATIIFAALFAIVIALIGVVRDGGDLRFAFLSNTEFYVPVLFFLIGFVVLVLIVNRARWWAHVFGSIFVALFVYFGTIATLLLINGVAAHTPEVAGTMLSTALVDPLVVAAALIGREVALWIGFAISARGRRLTARNAEARAAYDAEVAEKRADYDRATA